MKILGAIVAICLAVFLFFQAHDMEGMSLARFGYIAAAIILIVVTIFIYVPPQQDRDR
ncbi:MAG: hypothetical protein OIF55_11510 [Amphritea sp.]|nr:hypothetical protein [Amphritea sp.]